MKIHFHPRQFPDKERILRIIERYAPFLPWWANEVVVSHIPSDEDDEGAGASCTHQKHYRRVAIQLSLRNFDMNDLDDLILHELAHSYNEPLNDAVEALVPLYVEGKREQKLLNEQLDRRIEEQTEDLTIMMSHIVQLLEDRNSNGKMEED